MLLFLDGQAHYGTAQLPVKYTAVDSAYCTWSIVPEGRFGNCVKRVSSSNFSPAGALLVAPLMTRLGPWVPTVSGVCGFALRVDDLRAVPEPLGASGATLLVIREGAQYHVRVDVTKAGTFMLLSSWTPPGVNPVLAESVEGISANTWHFVEFKWVIHATAGLFQIRVNNVLVLDFTGNTHGQASFFPSLGVWNAVALLPATSEPAPSLTLRLCDLYLADLAAADPSDVADFLGDGSIATIMPNAPGLATAWTPVPGTPNWDQVNEKPPDDDASYVRVVTPGARDVYGFEDIPAGAIVKGVHVNALLLKETEGTALIKPVVGQAGVAYDGPEQGVASLAYDRYLTQPYDLNPATTDPWTAAEVNAGEWGLLKSG